MEKKYIDACCEGNLSKVKEFLTRGCSPNVADSWGRTPLMISATYGHANVVSQLIVWGANIDKKDFSNLTALHEATERGHLKVVKALLNAGAKIDEVDKDHFTPLMLAVREGHHNVVSCLLDHGADVNKHDNSGDTALHIAAHLGRLEIVKILLNKGAELDQENNDHCTPLVLSVFKNNHDVTLHLITSGADVAQLTRCTYYGRDLGREALTYVIIHKHIEIAKNLITKGVGVEVLLGTSPPMTALMWTALKGYDSLTKELILQGVNVNFQDPDGCTALHYASCTGQLEIVKMLLSKGAKVDQVDVYHCTPLVVSILESNPNVMLHLIACGADVAKLTRGTSDGRDLGREALSYVITHKHIELAKILITKGVAIEGLLSTNPPMTALMWTAQEGYYSLTKQLILLGVNVNYQNPDRRTALHYASRTGQLEIVKMLLSKRAKVDQVDVYHYTPLVVSVLKNYHNITLHLIASGADIAQLARRTYYGRDLGRDALSYVITHKHIELAKNFIAKRVGIKGLLNTSPPMTALMLTALKGYDSLTKELILQGVNVNFQDPDGCTALHYASYTGQLEIVKILLSKGAKVDQVDVYHCTPLIVSVLESNHDVMLHLIASGADVAQLARRTYYGRDLGREALSYVITHKHIEVSKILITKGVAIEGLVSTSPPMTALMLTAKEGYDSLTKELILRGVNVNYRNPNGCTALHFSAQHNHIQCGILLVEAGADVSIGNEASQTPLDLSSCEFKEAILQTLSFQTKKTVCVIGNAMSGKSTLIASLQNENASFVRKFRNRLFGVQVMSERTAGIEPVSLKSKRYGDVMFFDFAGQHEYHGPHEMFLESILSEGLSTVTIIVVVKATEEESAVGHQLNRWLHPFTNLSSSANPVRVIMIGSHMDKVKRKVEAKEKLKVCYRRVKDSLVRDIPLKFGDLCYLNCRKPYSSDISKLCAYLSDVPPPQYKAKDTAYSICWVISRIHSSFEDKVISVLEFSDWIAHNKANLPTNLPPAEEVCKDLSSTGHFLYLPSKEGTSNGWLVLDLPSILHEVYGTLFSPSKIVNKFGLLNCQRLSVLFPTFDPSMVRDVLISLEFCIEVDPSILSKAIHLMDNSDEGHEHLFFPALVAASPPNVFTATCEGRHILNWQLLAGDNSFLSPRLLQTIILRLAAHHVFHHKQGSETREHYCSVWSNGIFWQSHSVDIAVEISNNTVVQVIGRSEVSPEVLCANISTIIQDIFGTIHDLSPRLSGGTYMIHPVNPQALLESPRSPSPQEMFPVELILESRRNDEKACLSCKGKEERAVRKLISDVFGGFEPSVDVIKLFRMPLCKYMCECTYIYVVCVVYVCVHACVCVHVYVCAYMCVCMCVCVCMRVCVCMLIFMCAHICSCMFAWMYTIWCRLFYCSCKFLQICF